MYADRLRDAWLMLAQVPVAGAHATDYYWQQWVERTSAFLSRVNTRVALARPPVMADVLSEDLLDASATFVQEMVSLPSETAQYFNRRVEQMVREITEQLQPGASADLKAYLAAELEKLSVEVDRLRQVAATEAERRPDARGPGPGVAELRAIQRALARSRDAIAKRRSLREPARARATRLRLRLREIRDEVAQVAKLNAGSESEKLRVVREELKRVRDNAAVRQSVRRLELKIRQRLKDLEASRP